MLEPVLECQVRKPYPKASRNGEPISVTQSDKTELGGRINNQVFRQSAQVGHGQACPHHEFSDEITISDAPHAVFRDGLEAQFLGQEFAVHDERIASQWSASQWKDRNTRHKLLEPLKIGLEGQRMGKKQMSPTDRLSSLDIFSSEQCLEDGGTTYLQVSVAGHQNILFVIGPFN